jgi:hypothetical protein
MSEMLKLYVNVDYRDPEGKDHARGESVTVQADDKTARELLYRGILSITAPRRQAGENSARVAREGGSE